MKKKIKKKKTVRKKSGIKTIPPYRIYEPWRKRPKRKKDTPKRWGDIIYKNLNLCRS